jgi:hypothetical protein
MIKELIVLAFWLAAGCALLGFGTWGAMSIEQSWHCSNYQKATGKPTKLVGLECFVEVTPGDWRARGEIRQVDVR